MKNLKNKFSVLVALMIIAIASFSFTTKKETKHQTDRAYVVASNAKHQVQFMGKCGNDKTKDSIKDAKKCGEGRCGEGKAKDTTRCGEGKCGDDKKKEAKKSKSESRCGTGKCGAE